MTTQTALTQLVTRHGHQVEHVADGYLWCRTSFTQLDADGSVWAGEVTEKVPALRAAVLRWLGY